jgi:hypothetical protein
MKRLLVLVLVIVSVCIGGLIAGRSQEQKTKTRAEREQERRERKEQLGRYTRAVYRGLLDPGRDKIPDLVAKENRDVQLIRGICSFSLTPFEIPPTLHQVLKDKACFADAIVIGVVKAQTSRLTEDETDIYTINELDVTSVLKDNLAQPIKPGEQINVLRTGGTLEVKGRKVTALYYDRLWLETAHTYLLFLSFVPEKGVHVTNDIGVELKNGKLITLSKGQVAPGLETGNDANSFISSVRAAVAAPCDD